MLDDDDEVETPARRARRLHETARAVELTVALGGARVARYWLNGENSGSPRSRIRTIVARCAGTEDDGNL